MKVFIIGITGVGKSILGKKLARKLKFGFIDLDAYIQIREKKSIIDMFSISKEYFRDAEQRALFAVNKYDNHVISTGGGIILNSKNIEFMRKNGLVIQLHRPLKNIVKRINILKRPLLKNANNVYQLYEDRKLLYEQARHVIIDCTNRNQAITDMIRAVKKYGEDHENKNNKWT